MLRSISDPPSYTNRGDGTRAKSPANMYNVLTFDPMASQLANGRVHEGPEDSSGYIKMAPVSFDGMTAL